MGVKICQSDCEAFADRRGNLTCMIKQNTLYESGQKGLHTQELWDNGSSVEL